MPDDFVLRVGQRLAPIGATGVNPNLEDWQQCNLGWIRRALELAQAREAGGWCVLDGSRAISPDKPHRYDIDGSELVAWRGAQGQLQVAPNACPHMQGPLADGHICDGKVVCPWHGLALGKAGRGPWQLFEAFDDGVLAWVRLPALGETPTERPAICERPKRFIDAVIRTEATCAPEDVIQNRLDPWHGAHFHAHTFSQLRVVERLDDEITVRVSYRLFGRVGVEVDARFHCPDPRTIVMTIVRGEGTGSVVETHATPLGGGRTAITEATLVASDRPAFGAMRRFGRPIIRRFMKHAARRLWVEDGVYAERLAELRRRENHALDESDHSRRNTE